MTLTLLITILSAAFLYKIFDRHGYFFAFFYNSIIYFLIDLISQTIISIYNAGLSTFIIYLVVKIVSILLISFADYKLYDKISSTVGYVILAMLYRGIIVFAFDFFIQMLLVSL